MAGGPGPESRGSASSRGVDPSPPTGLPVEPTAYPKVWRVPGTRRWRPLLALLLAVAGYVVLAAAMDALSRAWLTLRQSGMDADEASQYASTVEYAIALVVAAPIAMVLLVPLSKLLSRLVGQKGRWLSSVTGRVRWGWLAQCVAICVALVAAYALIAQGLGGSEPAADRARGWFILPVVLVLWPMMAAGTEYLLRGVVNRGAASLPRSPAVGIVLGAVVSSAAYVLMRLPTLIPTGDVWGGVVWFLLGLVLSCVVWRTGGLEASIAVNIAYSLLYLMPWYWFFDGLEMPGQSATGPAALLRLVPLVVAAGLIMILARMRRVERTTPPQTFGGNAP